MSCAKNVLRNIVKATGARNATKRTTATLTLKNRGRPMPRIRKLKLRYTSPGFNEIESNNKITNNIEFDRF